VLDELLPMYGLEPEERAVDALDALEETWVKKEAKDRLDTKTLMALRGEQTKRGALTGKEGKLETERVTMVRTLGITRNWFDDRRTDLRKRFEQQLPQNLVEQVLPSRANKYATAL